jgi:hypothetical protein
MKELTRIELAACKRVAANTKSLKTKLAKLTAKIEELKNQQVAYLEEIRMWEAPIMEKYGYSVDEILDGTYLIPTCVEKLPESISVEEELNVEAFESYVNPSTVEVE